MLDSFQKFKLFFKNFKNYEYFLGLMILSLLIIYCIALAYSKSNNIDFHPLNGDFQNYNILRRLSDGQFFIDDFNSYLGIGTMLFIYFIYFLDGANGLSSSIFATYLSTQLLFIISSLFVLRLFKINFFISTVTIFLLYFIAMESIYNPIAFNFQSIIMPENSIYGLRMSLPYLFTISLYYILPTNLNLSNRQKSLYAIASGASLLWSNDYSLPVYFFSSLLFLLIIVQSSNKKSKDILQYGVISILTFLTLLTIVTGGAPYRWIAYNFIGIASDQYWYYLGSVIFEPSQIPIKLFIILEVVFAIFLLFKKDKNRYLLSLIILSSILAGYLSQIGGRISDRYFVQTFYLLYLLPIGVILFYLQKK